MFPRQFSKHDFKPILTQKKKDFARVVGDYLRKQRRDQLDYDEIERPFVIELAGTPNAGKDTLIEIIKDYLEDGHGYKVRVFDEGIKFCHIDKRLEVDRVYKTVASVVVQLYEANFENPGDYDFVIFNRGLFDRLAFLRTLSLSGRISQDQEQIHINYLLSYADLQDRTFLFLIAPEEALRREVEQGKKRNFVNELSGHGKAENKLREQRVFNTEMLTQLNSSYLYMYRTYKEWFDNQIHLFDSTYKNDASILEKARALVDTTLPDHSAQLPFPELFGVYYANGHSLDSQAPKRQQCSFKSSDPLPSQLSFSWM